MNTSPFKVICVALLISLWTSTGTDAGDFVTLIDGYSSARFPVMKLPWSTKAGYLEDALPEGKRIFSQKKDYRVQELTLYQRDNPEVELYFYENQLCEVAYFSRHPSDICIENFSKCDDFGKQLHLIIKKYGPGRIGNERMVIWPAGYQVERKRLWSVGNITVGLYEMTGSATSMLMAKHTHLDKAIEAAQQKYRQEKTKASIE